MNLRLITDDNTLKSFLPNAFTTVDGEQSFFEKLANWLFTTEQWFSRYFTGDSALEAIISNPDKDNLKSLSCQIVANEALRQAIPSLDVVLTPNGFGVVNNSNIAPASKDRIERLIDSLCTARDNAIIELLNQLRSLQEWQTSAQHDYYAQTMFPNISVVAQCGHHARMWEKFQEILPEILKAETVLEESYISAPLMRSFRNELISPTPLQGKRAVAVAIISAQIIHYLKKGSFEENALISAVNFIRKNPSDFPEWKDSDTARLYNPPIFQNKKDSGCYFF